MVVMPQLCLGELASDKRLECATHKARETNRTARGQRKAFASSLFVPWKNLSICLKWEKVSDIYRTYWR